MLLRVRVLPIRTFDLVRRFVQSVDDEVGHAQIQVDNLFQQRSECFQFQSLAGIFVIQALHRSRNLVHLNSKLTHKRTKDPDRVKSLFIGNVAIVDGYYSLCGGALRDTSKVIDKA